MGNAHDRRVRRRKQQRQWQESQSSYSVGESVKLTSDLYGKRYQNTTVSLVGKAQKAGCWNAISSKQKSPLCVSEDCLVKKAVKKAA